MPDKSFARPFAVADGVEYALHNSLATEVLLIAAHDFNLVAGRSSTENGVEAVYVKQSLG